MNTGSHGKTPQDNSPGSQAGLTLVEVVIAMALVALVCGGLYAAGLKARQFAEHNRLATEARSLAKERLEELIAYGGANLATNLSLLAVDTNLSGLSYPIVRQPSLVWHSSNGSVAGFTNAAYAEAHVKVTYFSPLTKTQRNDLYSMIIER